MGGITSALNAFATYLFGSTLNYIEFDNNNIIQYIPVSHLLDIDIIIIYDKRDKPFINTITKIIKNLFKEFYIEFKTINYVNVKKLEKLGNRIMRKVKLYFSGKQLE